MCEHAEGSPRRGTGAGDGPGRFRSTKICPQGSGGGADGLGRGAMMTGRTRRTIVTAMTSPSTAAQPKLLSAPDSADNSDT